MDIWRAFAREEGMRGMFSRDFRGTRKQEQLSWQGSDVDVHKSYTRHSGSMLGKGVSSEQLLRPEM